VQFDNFVIELLQYREADQPMGGGDSWAEPRDHMSPAYPRSMHICFHLRDDVDFAKIRYRSRGRMRPSGDAPGQGEPHRNNHHRRTTKGRADERKGQQDHAGQIQRLALICCKGPEGEQLEFVQALDPVKTVFREAMERRSKAVRHG
jgi:hypothetical protein